MIVEHWESYYRGGAIASCPMGPSSTYTLELRELWLDFFANLADGARIVDIGTGNGAIPLFAKEAAVAACKKFEIHGADLATIDPLRHVPNGAVLFSGIIFHPGMRSEQLGFEPASVDAITGQYSLEYANIGQALTEIRRVLKPGGRAQFVLHHYQSALIRNARESLAHGALVLEDTKVLRKLRRHVDAERDATGAARVTGAALSEAVSRLQRAATSSFQPHLLNVVIDGVQGLLGIRRRLPAAAWEREVDRFERDVRGGVRRLHDLVSCAQSAEQMEMIAATARQLGLACDSIRPQLHAGENLVGWRMTLSSP